MLKILFISAEMSPFAKTGGLADVAGSLPRALAALGNDVRVAMPRYKAVKTHLTHVVDFPVQLGGSIETCIIKKTEIGLQLSAAEKDVTVYFIENYGLFDRDGMYCHEDDARRFAFFCISVLEMLPKIDFKPDIIHCNDWHTGPICMLLKEKYSKKPYYKSISTVFTIHNLEYQGNFPKDALNLFNIGEEVFSPEKVEFYGMFSFMKAGLVYSDVISTVSRMYAREIQTPEFGERMDGLLRKRADDLHGIVNGINYEEFNPEIDPHIFKNYSVNTFEDKKENKAILQKKLGLPIKDIPVVGLISRLSFQKGLELVIEKMDEIMKKEIQFVLLGTGDEHYERAFRELKNRYQDKMGLYIGFNERLARIIYAGSDIFLMPSRFEPCGLGQIISLKYGTIPIVRATGGLAETVDDCGEEGENGNGFVFEEFSADEMLKTIERALNIYRQRPKQWKQLVARAMMCDFSWDRPAKKYMELYKLAIEKTCN